MFFTFPKQPDERLRIWTNLALLTAVILGLIVCALHGGAVTVSIAAFGASLGVGGVLGFLFGIPGTTQPHISIGRVDTVAVSSGQGSRIVGAVTETAPQPPDQTQAPAPPAPPAPPDQQAAAAPTATPDATVNPQATSTTAASNLEQVADWVTKLLLGGGLTQMQRIPPKIWQWSRNVAIGIINGDATPQVIQAQQAFAAGVLVYGFILGFFSGFLITKLQLGKAVA